jgi:hypothetical protein
MVLLDPLQRYLLHTDSASLSLIFEQVEDIIGAYLPGAARQSADWWANTKDKSAPEAAAWLDAGWTVREVNMEEGWVVFKKK